MARVAIIGSCITRDLWPVRSEAADLPLYVSRTSFASLLAPPLTGLEPQSGNPPGLGRHQHRAVLDDLLKTAVADLMAFAPTHLIFDFIDERFDLLSVGGTRVTRSWELEQSGYRDQPAFAGARRIPRLSQGCFRLWREGVEAFAALVRSTPLRNASLILHAARWADQTCGADGTRAALTGVEVLEGEPADVAAYNRLMALYDDEFARLMPPLQRVEAPAWQAADPAHRWGLSAFHYTPGYYVEIGRQLRALGVPVPATAAPSPRAA